MDVVSGLLVILGIVALSWVTLVGVLWLHRPSRELVGPAFRLIPDLIRLIRALVADPTTPRSAKLALAGLLGYLLLPLDLIPDFVPVVGSLDDVILTALVLRWVGRRVGTDHLRAHWSGTDAGFELVTRLL